LEAAEPCLEPQLQSQGAFLEGQNASDEDRGARRDASVAVCRRQAAFPAVADAGISACRAQALLGEEVWLPQDVPAPCRRAGDRSAERSNVLPAQAAWCLQRAVEHAQAASAARWAQPAGLRFLAPERPDGPEQPAEA
jgi:hypothetical protein